MLQVRGVFGSEQKQCFEISGWFVGCLKVEEYDDFLGSALDSSGSMETNLP